jgi:hypothetical protein
VDNQSGKQKLWNTDVDGVDNFCITGRNLPTGEKSAAKRRADSYPQYAPRLLSLLLPKTKTIKDEPQGGTE